VLNSVLLEFATWLDGLAWTNGIHESLYLYNWIETTHVLTLMLSLGMLFMIDLRMLGLALPNVPATKLAERLDKPMLIGFTIMLITGVLLYSAIPVRTTQSLWFRIKIVLLIAAAANAWIFRKHMRSGVWERDLIPPRRAKLGAGVSLALWCGVIITGRFIAYDWFDCGQPGNSAFINWAAGCVAEIDGAAG
jgi:hypothetical protein